eukprot:1883946-Pyramimonas_sp.AAC.1
MADHRPHSGQRRGSWSESSAGPCLSFAPAWAGPAYGGGADLALSASAFSVSPRLLCAGSREVAVCRPRAS